MKKRYFVWFCVIALAVGLILAGCDIFEAEQQQQQQQPALSGTVTIDKTSPRVGDVLTASYSGNGTGTPSWQWYRGDSSIGGAASRTYTVTSADVGKTLKAQVAFANQKGTVTSASTASVAAALLPELTGTVTLSVGTGSEMMAVDSETIIKVGDILTAAYIGNGTGVPMYGWLRGSAMIDGMTGRTYTVVGADIGKTLRALVSTNEQSGNIYSTATNAVVDNRPELTGTVTLDNSAPKAGDTITATYTDGNGTGAASWQWLYSYVYGDVPIDDATDAAYTVAAADVGKILKAQVSYADQSGTASAVTAAVAAADGFVAVTGISGGDSATVVAGSSLLLDDLVVVNPSNATNKTITWSVKDAGTTGATIAAGTGVLTTTSAGTVVVTATIANGTAQGTAFTKDYTITVVASSGSAFVAVTDITGISTTGTAGSLMLTGTVMPSNATNQTIAWSVTSAGTTGATISGNILNTTAVGTTTVRASIANGTAQGTHYTKDFTITISPPLPPPDPFVVNNVATLKKVGSGVDGWTLSASYIQTANINLSSSENWTAIGGNSSYSGSFTGTYDGGGYTISNLTIIGTDLSWQGLFRFIGIDGTVKNINLRDVNISITTISGEQNGYAGGIAGINSGTIENCSVSGSISSISTSDDSNYSSRGVGGIVGATSKNIGNIGGKVVNCFSTANITGDYFVGGVVGESSGTGMLVSNCYATGDITGKERVGGVVGQNLSGLVENCVALNQNVTTTSGYVGRITGTAWGILVNNYARSDMNVMGTNSVDTGAETINGEDIYPSDWNNASWWQNPANFSADVWIFGSAPPTLK